MVAMSVFRREVQVLLQGEIGSRLRACAVALGVAVSGCAAFALPASAGEVRHYEQVSPPDKGDGDIVAEGQSIVASKSGDGVVFVSRMGFGDAAGSGVVGRVTYLARRLGDTWSTHSITPTPRPEPRQIGFGTTKVEVFSDDLSRALVWGYDFPASTNDTPNRENLYVEDTATGALQPISVSQAQPLSPFALVTPTAWGVSADARHVAFVINTQMLSDAAPGVDNVYKWDDGEFDDGVLSLVGVLPDGSVPPAGSTVLPANHRGAMSTDGRRLAFTASPDFVTPPQLYLHIDGRRSVLISDPEGSDRTPPSGVAFQGMTPDGKNIFFVSDSPLLDGDTAPGPDLYRFTDSDNPASDANLRLVTNTGGALDNDSFGAALVGMSDDGSRVYVHQIGGELLLWADGVTKTIDPAVSRAPDPRQRLTLTASQPGYGRVTPDADYLAYISNSQMFVYDRRADVRTCVSCPGDAFLVPGVTAGGRLDDLSFRSRWLTPDGTVFFSSTGALVPEDTNGVGDVYEYDAPSRTLSLITSGKGRDAMEFADASESGDDVFIVTRQRLAAADRDDYADLYDVRVGPAPPVKPIVASPPCEGETCQGTPSVAPADDLLGSLMLDGDQGSDPPPGLTVKHRIAISGPAGTLRVRLGASGRLKWNGRGLAAGTVKRSAGTAKLRLRLKHRARRQLKRAGHYTTRVALTFLAADGTRATRAVRVTFTKKGR
jgi:WD40-like Beta Propeller Repeat